MKYKPTLTSSIEYAELGKLEEWIHLFLCGEGKNKAFSDGLKLKPRFYFSPQLLELFKFRRCCGPEKYMKYKVDKEYFENHVNNIMTAYNKGNWDMPPLIINHDKKKYELNDGNHRYEALRKLGINKYWVIIWETINGK